MRVGCWVGLAPRRSSARRRVRAVSIPLPSPLSPAARCRLLEGRPRTAVLPTSTCGAPRPAVGARTSAAPSGGRDCHGDRLVGTALRDRHDGPGVVRYPSVGNPNMSVQHRTKMAGDGDREPVSAMGRATATGAARAHARSRPGSVARRAHHSLRGQAERRAQARAIISRGFDATGARRTGHAQGLPLAPGPRRERALGHADANTRRPANPARDQ